MTARHFKIVSSVLALASLVCIAIGARLREAAPRFNDWFVSSVPGGNPGSVLGVWWVSVTIFWAVLFVFLFVAIGVLGALPARPTRKKRLVLLFRAGVLGVLLMMAVILSRGAAGDLIWGFTLLGVGESGAVAALILGVISSIREPNQHLQATPR